MNMKTRIAKFLITLTSFGMMTSVNAYQGSNCCDPCGTFDPCCPTPNRSFYAQADYIYWAVHQDGLRFVNQGFGADCCNEEGSTCGCGTSSSTAGNGNCRDLDCNWNSGFKVGAGMVNPCSDWEVFVQYTWYQANPKRHVQQCGDCDLLPTWGFFNPLASLKPTDFLTLSRADAQWKLNWNVLDALVTNEFSVNNCFSFRPSFGIKAAWETQKFNIAYVYNFNSDLVNYTGYTTAHKQQWWGVGPKFALGAAASLYDSFSLYGNVGISTIWGQDCVRRSDAFIAQTSDNVITATLNTVCARQSRYRVTPVLESQFGARWDTDLCCGDYGFYVNVAWEQQVWFDHNDFIDTDVNHTHGNLTFQGLTVGAGFSF